VADEVLSTGGMARYAARPEVREVIVGTEVGMVYRLQKDNPGKIFYDMGKNITCPNMKRITLTKILRALEEMAPRITVPDDIAARAKEAVDRMLAVS
jgi:quinolinate synthase